MRIHTRIQWYSLQFLQQIHHASHLSIDQKLDSQKATAGSSFIINNLMTSLSLITRG